MAIALIGASGRTGRELLARSIKRGWPVRALVRHASRLPAVPTGASLKVLEGDARDIGTLREAIRGSGAVLCALGMHDISRPATDFSDSLKAIVEAMKAERVRRIVAIASAGVLDHPQGGLRIDHGIPDWLAHVSAEHARNLHTLRASGLDWTLMCPLALVDDIPVGHGDWAFEALPDGSAETGYADLAYAMATLATDRKALRQRVGIVSRRPARNANEESAP